MSAMISMNLSDTATSNIKVSDYCFISGIIAKVRLQTY